MNIDTSEAPASEENASGETSEAADKLQENCSGDAEALQGAQLYNFMYGNSATPTPQIEPVFPDIVCKKAANTINNLYALLNFCELSVRYNVISKRIEITGFAEGGDMGDEANFMRLESYASQYGVSERIAKKITIVADDNPYNPVIEYFESYPWDGVSRMQEMFNTVGVKAEDFRYRDAVMRTWFLQCVAAADNGEKSPNPIAKKKFEYILVLQGEQGINKGIWFNDLVDSCLNEYILDGAHLNPNNKDSVFTVISHWLVELGELDTTIKKSEVSEQKAFLSKRDDKARRPYDRVDSNYARRTSFFGTINPTYFLVDPTGSRRYIPISVTGLTTLPKDFNKQQFWSEVWNYYLKGEAWWPDAQLEYWVRLYSKNHQQISNIEDALLSYFDLSDTKPDKDISVRTCTEILALCNRERPTQKELNDTGEVLRKYGFKIIDYGRRGYRLKLHPERRYDGF